MLGRRPLLAGAVAAAVATRVHSGLAQAGADSPDPPAQVAGRTDFIAVPGAYLSYRDSGGPGAAIVLLHPLNGSVESWIYQQPAFAGAGYRVVTYSRRGFNPSEVIDASKHPSDADDLLAVVDGLHLKRFHLVGCAEGGTVAADFAGDHADRLRSLTLAGSTVVEQDPLIQRSRAALEPKGFSDFFAAFRELGPSYRAVNPVGVARWTAIAQSARAGQPDTKNSPFSNQPASSFSGLPARVAKLLVTGDADEIMPPALLRQAMNQMKNAELAIIAGAGHAAYWEQPATFNRVVLDFVSRHSGSE